MGDSRFASVQWDTRVEVDVATLDDLITRCGEPKFCKIEESLLFVLDQFWRGAVLDTEADQLVTLELSLWAVLYCGVGGWVLAR